MMTIDISEASFTFITSSSGRYVLSQSAERMSEVLLNGAKARAPPNMLSLIRSAIRIYLGAPHLQLICLLYENHTFGQWIIFGVEDKDILKLSSIAKELQTSGLKQKRSPAALL